MMMMSSSASRCQECGNQAKRDCEYMRCRTCCKSRGFHCATHINSTWIPLSLRRPRQYYFHHPHPHSHSRTVRYHHPFNLSASSNSPGIQTGDFPTEMNTTATFRCVRMMSSSSEDNNVVDQCAYEANVEIGGHIFKGLLYDQGPILLQDDNEEQENYEDHGGCYTSINGHHVHQQFQVHEQEQQHQSLTPNLNITSALPPPSSSTSCENIVSSSPYPCPFYPFLPGMLYFPCPKS